MERPAFGAGGTAIADFFQGIENVEEIRSLALQADGKIVAAGNNRTFSSRIEIIRFNTDGTIDQSFATQGAFIFGATIGIEGTLAVAVQDDQKIVFSGFRQQIHFHITLFRLLPNGSLDVAFGTNGVVYADFGTSDVARSIVPQPNGKILVGAESKDSISPSNNVNTGPFLVLRYNSNGSLDSTFGNNGQVKTPAYEYGLEDGDLMLQPDGKIIHASNLKHKIVLWRYLNDLPVGLPEIPVSDFQLQCSPNPVSESANLSWTQEESGEVHCDLYDWQGKFLQTIIPPTFVAAGLHQKTIHLGSETPNGTCILIFKVGKEQQIARLIKM